MAKISSTLRFKIATVIGLAGMYLSFGLALASLMDITNLPESYVAYAAIGSACLLVIGIFGIREAMRAIGPMIEEKRRNHYKLMGHEALYNGSV